MAKPGGQIALQFFQKPLAILRALFPMLFEFHNPPPDLPIRRRHQRVDRAGGGAPGRLQQFTGAAHEAGVISNIGTEGFRRFLHAVSTVLSSLLSHTPTGRWYAETAAVQCKRRFIRGSLGLHVNPVRVPASPTSRCCRPNTERIASLSPALDRRGGKGGGPTLGKRR
jgi:hypothetical protein